MIDFNRISVNQIIYLSEIINESSLAQQEFIQTKYLRAMQNYQTTIEFLKTLHLIEIQKGTILVKSAYKELLREIKKPNNQREIINRHLIKHIFDTKNEFKEYINQFFSYFSLHDGHYEFKPTLKQKLQYSGIRNFLMELHILGYDSTDAKYVIQDHFVLAYPELNEGHLVSEKDFKKIQKLKEEIGKAAEEAVLKYEKARLAEFPHIVDKIEHVAIVDVSAGYDIKSFDCDNKKEFIPRLIEVKAVSSWNFLFYWTKNEIETSRLNGKRYYLYLLPVYTRKEFDLNGLRIIQDPFTKVGKNEKVWTPTIETISYSLCNETQIKENSDET